MLCYLGYVPSGDVYKGLPRVQLLVKSELVREQHCMRCLSSICHILSISEITDCDQG